MQIQDWIDKEKTREFYFTIIQWFVWLTDRLTPKLLSFRLEAIGDRNEGIAISAMLDTKGQAIILI